MEFEKLEQERISPACVGKTPNIPNIPNIPIFIQDQPRVCGKDSKTRKENRKRGGSAPRVWERRLLDPLFIGFSELNVRRFYSLLMPIGGGSVLCC